MPKNTDKYTQFLAKTAKIKETIYGLTSLLAVCLGLWLHLGQTSAWQALGLVVGSAVGLWLTCFFADLLAHSITVADKHERRHAYAHAFDASLGIIHAVRMPVFFLVLVGFGMIMVKTAVLSSIIALVVQLFIFVLLSLYHRQNGLLANIATIGIQVLIFGLILLLKLGH